VTTALPEAPPIDEPLKSELAARQAVLDEVRAMLVRQLNIRREPHDIDPDTPLFGSGLGLDSVDAVELVVGMETGFQVKVSDNRAVVGSMRTVNVVVDFILRAQAQR
jgi:acyl carrier protein